MLARTVQKLAHKRQNDELIASQSTSGRSSPELPDEELDIEPDTDHPAAQDDEAGTHRRGHNTPSPQPRLSAVPVVLVPSNSFDIVAGSQEGQPLVALSPPGTAESEDTITPGSTSRDGSRGSPSSSDTISVNDPILPIQQLRLAPSEHASGSRFRSRSPSPSPIRIPPSYKTDIDLSSEQTPQSRSHRRVDHRDSNKHGHGHGHGHDGHNGQDEHEKPQVEEGQYLKSRLWWSGMILIAVGEGGNFLSYGFAPASVVAPLGTVVRVLPASPFQQLQILPLCNIAC